MNKNQIKFVLTSPITFTMLILDDIREALKPKIRELKEMYYHLGDTRMGKIDEEKTDLEMEDQDGDVKDA